MTVQIADATNCITITIDSVVRWTLPKRQTVVEVRGNNLDFRNSGEYLEAIAYADVTSPVTANIEALRVAVKNFLIS